MLQLNGRRNQFIAAGFMNKLNHYHFFLCKLLPFLAGASFTKTPGCAGKLMHCVFVYDKMLQFIASEVISCVGSSGER